MDWTRQRIPLSLVSAFLPIVPLSVSCTDSGQSRVSEFAEFAEARELWVEREPHSAWSSKVSDMKAESRNVVWVADGETGAIFRLEPASGSYNHMGIGDREPLQIEAPVKIAVESTLGIFAFDWNTRHIDHLTLDGIPLSSFEPEFVPARIEIVADPVGLVFAVVNQESGDSIPRLTVFRSDFKGEQRDTLLAADRYGPPPLWSATAAPGQLAVDAGVEGLWIWAKAVPDTVFELSAASETRKRVLRPEDRSPLGILVDGPRQILWIVSASHETELRYSAYDLRATGSTQPEQSFLGERTTTGFSPRVAEDGVVIGMTASGQDRPRLAAYDMLVPESR